MKVIKESRNSKSLILVHQVLHKLLWVFALYLKWHLANLAFLQLYHLTLLVISLLQTCKNRIYKFSNTGQFITKWGYPGTGSGQFNHSNDLATDRFGNVYVTDGNNNRVQVFNNVGLFLRTLGLLGNQPGQFNNPFGIAVDSNGSIFVTDEFNNRVERFTPCMIFTSPCN